MVEIRNTPPLTVHPEIIQRTLHTRPQLASLKFSKKDLHYLSSYVTCTVLLNNYPFPVGDQVAIKAMRGFGPKLTTIKTLGILKDVADRQPYTD